MTPVARHPGDASLSLGAVAELPLGRRCEHVQAAGQADLTAALRRLQEDVPEAHRAMSPERLAWAVAFNVTGEGLATDARPARGKRTYLDYWSPETSWSTVWSELAASPTGDGPGRAPLVELATSVACEQRSDWQHPSAPRLDPAQAHTVFAALYDRYLPKVTGYVARQFRRRAGDPQDVAVEAWSRVFLEYWSADAWKRVLGISAISSLVCGTAYYVGCDLLRRQKGRAAADPAVPPGRLAVVERVADAGGDPLEAAELETHVRRCRTGLPARQQVAARMVWDYEMRQIDVARQLGVSAPAVSQLLDKARKAMHACLKSKGLVATRGFGAGARRAPRRPR